MYTEQSLQLQIVDCENKDSGKGDCPAVLEQIWRRQLRIRQLASETAYAKKHSLEMVFGPKIFASKLADRSNYSGQVA